MRTDGPVLETATPAHLDFIRRLLREGAAEGAFDHEIAGGSAAAAPFFANLAGALGTGCLRVGDADGNLTGEAHVAGYVYRIGEASPPVGFGLFKQLGAQGFELWLTAVARDARRQGHGRAMLAELLATPSGRLASLVRCARGGAGSDAEVRLFRRFGFAPCRVTPATVWLVSAGASPDLLARNAALPTAA
jgi:ribosomal protein S18 acetylase RimI-like enzyme